MRKIYVFYFASAKGARCVLITTYTGTEYSADNFALKAFDCGGHGKVHSIMCEKELGG